MATRERKILEIEGPGSALANGQSGAVATGEWTYKLKDGTLKVIDPDLPVDAVAIKTIPVEAIPATETKGPENLMYPSEDLNTLWTGGQVVNGAVDELIADGTSGAHFKSRNIAKSWAAGTYTASIRFRAGNKTWARLRLYDGTDLFHSYVDITNMAIGITDLVDAYRITVSDGWTQLDIQISLNSASSLTTWVYPAEADNNTSFIGDNSTVNIYASNVHIYKGSIGSKAYAETTTHEILQRIVPNTDELLELKSLGENRALNSDTLSEFAQTAITALNTTTGQFVTINDEPIEYVGIEANTSDVDHILSDTMTIDESGVKTIKYYVRNGAEPYWYMRLEDVATTLWADFYVDLTSGAIGTIAGTTTFEELTVTSVENGNLIAVSFFVTDGASNFKCDLQPARADGDSDFPGVAGVNSSLMTRFTLQDAHVVDNIPTIKTTAAALVDQGHVFKPAENKQAKHKLGALYRADGGGPEIVQNGVEYIAPDSEQPKGRGKTVYYRNWWGTGTTLADIELIASPCGVTGIKGHGGELVHSGGDRVTVPSYQSSTLYGYIKETSDAILLSRGSVVANIGDIWDVWMLYTK